MLDWWWCSFGHTQHFCSSKVSRLIWFWFWFQLTTGLTLMAYLKAFKCWLTNLRQLYTCAFFSRRTLRTLQDINPLCGRSVLPSDHWEAPPVYMHSVHLDIAFCSAWRRLKKSLQWVMTRFSHWKCVQMSWINSLGFTYLDYWIRVPLYV